MVMAADQRPGNQAYQRLQELQAQYDELLQRVVLAQESLKTIGATHE